MSEVDDLIKSYEQFINLPWSENLSGQEKVWFIVYDPVQERRIRLKIAEFHIVTERSGYGWKSIDITDTFAEWMAGLEYREAFFQNPEDLDPMLPEYSEELVERIVGKMTTDDVNEQTVVAITGISSLFGITHASSVIDKLTPFIKGRLAVFFPGSFDGSVYRLLDARDGWNYLAIPITANKGLV